jgi:hypothetical protein
LSHSKGLRPCRPIVGRAHDAFAPHGVLVDRQPGAVERLGHTLASFLMRLKGCWAEFSASYPGGGLET